MAAPFGEGSLRTPSSSVDWVYLFPKIFSISLFPDVRLTHSFAKFPKFAIPKYRKGKRGRKSARGQRVSLSPLCVLKECWNDTTERGKVRRIEVTDMGTSSSSDTLTNALDIIISIRKSFCLAALKDFHHSTEKCYYSYRNGWFSVPLPILMFFRSLTLSSKYWFGWLIPIFAPSCVFRNREGEE